MVLPGALGGCTIEADPLDGEAPGQSADDVMIDGNRRDRTAGVGGASAMEAAGRPLDEPHPERLAPSHPAYREIIAAHRAALDADEPGYEDPVTGMFVFTAAALLEHGTCCGSGCRHCPYL